MHLILLATLSLITAATRPEAKSGLKATKLAKAEVRLRDAELHLLDRIEPVDRTGMDGKAPGIGFTTLNLAEALAVRLHLMRPEKIRESWVDDGALMRGSEQTAAGFQSLRDQGIKTVINLKREDNSEAPIVEGLGMKAVQIPLYDQALPSPIEVRKFFEVAEAPANQPVYVHCEQGIGRTGLMVALYRVHHDGLSADAAIAEAKANGMDSKEQFQYIRDFAAAEARGAPWATLGASPDHSPGH